MGKNRLLIFTERGKTNMTKNIMNEYDWIKNIDVSDLTPHMTPISMYEIQNIEPGEIDFDEVAYLISKDSPIFLNSSEIQEHKNDRPPIENWDFVKKEFFLLVCTEDKKYLRLKEQIKNESSKSKTTILAIVSAYIGDKLGIEISGIIGFCAIFLYMLAKIGKEAFCCKYLPIYSPDNQLKPQ